MIAIPGGPRSEDRTPRPGPRAVNKWLTGSVAHDSAEVIAAAFDQAHARDPDHTRTWVVLVDGDWYQIGQIKAEAARRGIGIHIVVDLIHCVEYIWTASRCFYTVDDPAAEDWVATQVLGLLAGRVEAIADTIESYADTTGLVADARRGADDAVRYFRGHADYLHYDHALAAGWPIATGVIEGAARHLVRDRLEIAGSRWGLDGAEAILRLRALIGIGDFPAYWRHHLAREHQRVHPGAHQLAA
ncbi:hypothetical protein GZH49_39780 [Nocardia terpenica]